MRGDAQKDFQAEASDHCVVGVSGQCGSSLDTDLLTEPKAGCIDVPPAHFKEHFENLFSKVSEQQTLNLTEDKVGPKSEVRTD